MDEGERAEMREWVDLAASSHPTTLKPWQYAVTGIRTKRPEDMKRYRELQPDPDLVAFHQRSLDGFSDEEIADAVARNHAILARMEGRLTDAHWLVGGATDWPTSRGFPMCCCSTGSASR